LARALKSIALGGFLGGWGRDMRASEGEERRRGRRGGEREEREEGRGVYKRKWDVKMSGYRMGMKCGG
jgi:hypothetical protein